MFAITITALSVWFYLSQTNASALSELAQLRQDKQALVTLNQTLQQQQLELEQKLEDQTQYLAIQKATDQQLKQRLDELQNKVVYLDKELMFYQNITQGNSSSKLQIRSLELNDISALKPDSVSYRVVITQGQRITKPLTGSVSLTLNYDQDKHVTIGTHELNLRHVQVLEDTLKLADNIPPKSITITLKQNKKTSLSKTFDWQIANQN